MPSVKSIIQTGSTVIRANSPVLLMSTAVVGAVSATIMAAVGGYKAREIIYRAELKKAEETHEGIDSLEDYEIAMRENGPLPLVEKVKLTWLCYTPAAITLVSSVASVVGLHVIHNRRHLAMASLYAVAESKLADEYETYKAKAEELLGEKKTEKLHEELDKKRAEEAFEDNEVIVLEGDSNQLCVINGRYFESNWDKIQKAWAECLLMLEGPGGAPGFSLNDFYDNLGLSRIDLGNHLGWSQSKMDNIYKSVEEAKNGKAAMAVCFRNEPQEGDYPTS